MKKWLIGIGLIIVIATACIYIFIPRELEVSVVSLVQCNPQAVFRQVSHDGNWGAWWPGGRSETDGKTRYHYAGDVYSFTGSSYPLAEVAITHEETKIKSRISVLSLSNKDSAAVYWRCHLSTDGGPLGRLRQYLLAVRLKGSMNGVLSKLRPFLEDEKNIYGMRIGEASTKDTMLVATKTLYRKYPGTTEIYDQLGRIRGYILKKGAVENGYPISNVTRMSDSGFQLIAAIPVDRVIPGEGGIYMTRIVPYKFLIAEIKGGDHTIRAAFGHLQEYIADHQRTVMALPYQTIITDRMKQRDTSQWSTWLYCPIL